MRRITSIAVTTLLLVSADESRGQDFSGKYSYRDDAVHVTLTLTRNAHGAYNGSISAQEGLLTVTGTVRNGVLCGSVGDALDAISFEARLHKNQLSFIMIELDDSGAPMAETAQTYIFQRGSSRAAGTATAEKKSEGTIIINSVVLSADQISALARAYGIKPMPGDYWYDAQSGLYGVVGYPAFGFMRPGHTFGTLKSDASHGNTRAFVNGRELPLMEYAVWSKMVGAWIQPGRYWLDGQGNAGYEGNPAPVINLYALAKQNSYHGQGGTGDNFWSSRFSAGNYDSDNSRGYVSVPGYGPVGYGF